jgi:hypothetical protein
MEFFGVAIAAFLQGGCVDLRVFWMVFCGENVVS